MRIVIAEDSFLLREGLVRLLELGGMTVDAAVGDADALLEAVERHDPDLVVVDVRMPPTHTDEGLRAALKLRKGGPRPSVLVLSQYVEERHATELLRGDTKGFGYLLKDRVADMEDFLATVRRVAEGRTAIDPEVVSQLLSRSDGPLDRLTPREYEVLELMAEGRSNGGIAEKLVVSESAVAKHVAGIFAKFDLPGTAQEHRRVLAVLKFLSGA
ncbi:response regulator transcription factor [Actinomadura barringtoniae]|uniref:Response regulator transcription factor n=1 Tax=Actinomadura barringtoniae TaxID=1427535 RepID=A0A939TFK4_9ACTN|nr:response regulator transcription factor [Actinomadura barringtoniae]MBO2454465.1 response regulator transcription factor [Actinomadura barringtoniae]